MYVCLHKNGCHVFIFTVVTYFYTVSIVSSSRKRGTVAGERGKGEEEQKGNRRSEDREGRALCIRCLQLYRNVNKAGLELCELS